MLNLQHYSERAIPVMYYMRMQNLPEYIFFVHIHVYSYKLAICNQKKIGTVTINNDQSCIVVIHVPLTQSTLLQELYICPLVEYLTSGAAILYIVYCIAGRLHF